MMNGALELFDAWPIGDIALCGKASTDNKVFALRAPTIGSFYVPSTFFGVELGFCDDGLKCCTFFDVDDFVAGVEVVP